MPPIQLSRSERASLRKLFLQPRQPGEIPADHQEKLINYNLVRKQVLLLYITPLGQIEFFRQGFRGLRRTRPPQQDMLEPFRRPLMLTSNVQEEAKS